MGSVILLKDERDKPNIEILGQDRGRNIQYGRRIDNPKIKVVHIGLTTPEIPKSYIQIADVRTKKVIHEGEANSYTRNYYNRLASQILNIGTWQFNTSDVHLGGSGYFNIRDTTGHYELGGSPAYLNYSPNIIEALSGTYGYQGDTRVKSGSSVGSGAGAWSAEDYTLTEFTHGVADGNLYFNPEIATVVNYNAGTRVWTAGSTRFLDNYGTTNITNINETGLYCYISKTGFTGAYLEERNVLSSPITVNANQCLRIKHSRQYTFPSVAGDYIRNGYNFWLSNALVCAITGSDAYEDGYRSLMKEDYVGAIDGNSASSTLDHNAGGCFSGASTSVSGILVGTGNTAVTLDDYALATKKVHSAAFTYGTCWRTAITWTAATHTFKITWSRTFTDVSAGNITIAEIALGWMTGLNNSSIGFIGIISRAVLGSAQALVNGESLEVLYTISMVLPSWG